MIRLGVVFFLLACCSCGSFLEEVPQSQLTEANFYRSAQDAVSAVNAAYDVLGNNGIYHFGATTGLMIPSANIYTTVERWRQFDDFSFLPEETEVIPVLYNRHYLGVMRSNAAINRIPGIEMDATLKQRLIGEAKFLRALYYFNLVRLFGEVPLVLQDFGQNDNPGRHSVEDVYAQILADLHDAQQALPLRYSGNEVGRATKGAAQALQARIHLTRKEWSQALQQTGDVIGSSVYDLWDDYAQAFKEGANYGKENIFEVGFKSGMGNPTSGEGNILSYYTTPSNTSLPGSPVFRPTVAFYESFESGDRRKTWGMYTQITLKGITYTFEPHIFKFTSERYFSGEESGWDASINYPLIRFADVLLMHAEAINESNGPVKEAYDALNRVRVRAGIGAFQQGDHDQASFREAVYRERGHELYFEGEDWFDLVRTGRLISEHARIGITVDARYLRFPIPQREIDVAGGALVQNEGY